MADAKEPEKGVDETLNINLNATLAEKDSKTSTLSHPENSTDNGQLRVEDKDDSAAEIPTEDTVVEAHQQFSPQDAKSLESGGDNVQGHAVNGSNIQATATNGGSHDDHEDKEVKLKSENDAFKEADIDSDNKMEDDNGALTKMELSPNREIIEHMPKSKFVQEHETTASTPTKSFHLDPFLAEGYESGTEEEQAVFAKEVERFYRENNLEYKAPKFYKEELNLLKLWRSVIKLGGYEQVTSCKLWRQVGESFRPPKTCTTVSWTFRIFYEKALLEYEKHKMRNGELPFSDVCLTEPIRPESQAPASQALGSGRARRDAAARAMQGWHSQRLLGNGQVCQPIIKDKNLNSTSKGDKQLKTNGLLKRKKPSNVERSVIVPHMKSMKPQKDSMVIDIGPPADWVKINVQRTSDCFEIYALVPGLLREEVHVQSDPAGRLIISGNPEQLDNPWGVTPFKKVVSLPSRIDPHQTSAVVTLHGQLFVRVPFELSDN